MATAAPVPSCKVCCKLLPNSRERRNLTSAASASVVAMIKEICSNLSLSAEYFVVQMPFLCRPCFRRVDRLITLKKELQELQTNLEVCTSTFFKLKKKRSIYVTEPGKRAQLAWSIIFYFFTLLELALHYLTMDT